MQREAKNINSTNPKLKAILGALFFCLLIFGLIQTMSNRKADRKAKELMNERAQFKASIENNQVLYEEKRKQLLAIKKTFKSLPSAKFELKQINLEVPSLGDWSPALSSYSDFCGTPRRIDTTYVDSQALAMIGPNDQSYPADESFLEKLWTEKFPDKQSVGQHAEFLNLLRYVVVIETVEISHGYTNGSSFISGFSSSKAHVFEIETAKHLGTFSFVAANTEDGIKFEYDPTRVASEGEMFSVLRDDLLNNTTLAFYRRLELVSPNAKIAGYEQGVKDLPYSAEALALAYTFSGQGRPETEIEIDQVTKDQVVKAAHDQGKVEAVKLIMSATGASLKPSIVYLESLISKSEN